MKIAQFFICIMALQFNAVIAQVKGKISDSDGHPLPFATIYIKGTTKGTSSNVEGNYELSLEKGKNKLVFQYMGYQIHEEDVFNSGQSILVNVTLHHSFYALNEIVVSSNQEDPAYEIMRKAISKRKFYLNQKPNYTCNAYTKGYIKILEAPKKILGHELGTLDGNLDTNRKGFVYLSETVSKLSFEKPDHKYEEMISSIISGRDNGFSFNSASSVNFDLYENTTEFGKNIVSPVADYAFSYYKYKLLGTDSSADSENSSYRIELIPINNSLRCWSGEINIRENDWSIQSANLFITGKQVQQEIFDTIYLRQLFIHLLEENHYKIQNQVFSFKANLLGIKLEGKFVIVFSDYLIDEKINIKEKNTLLKVQEGANEKSRNYWDSIRPVPLTVDEKTDYKLKDSIKVIRESKTYKDSVDKKNNQFKVADLFFGYDYKNSFEHRSFSVGSPIGLIHFNPIQGWSLGTFFKYNRTFKSEKKGNKLFTGEAAIDYGFSDKAIRPLIKGHYRFDRQSKSYIDIKAGNRLVEFNSTESSTLFNEINNLFFKRSYVKYFDKQFINIGIGRDVSNDLKFSSNVKYSIRKNVVNHSEFSYGYKSETYQSNTYADQFEDSLLIRQRNHLSWTSHINWSPATKVWITPKETTKLGTDFPRFDLDYTMGLYTNSMHYYHRIGLKITKNFNFGNLGEMIASWKGSQLFYNHELDTPERIYQNGNALSFILEPAENDFFLSIYPYGYSSTKQSASWFIEHNFQGLFLDRIPFINKFGLNELFRYSSVSIPGASPYTELSIGLGNVGYKLFRLLRVDCVNQFYEGKFKGTYFVVGINSSF